MNNYLVSHAMQNVWCSPNQDNQVVIEPKRISPRHGSMNTALIIEQIIDLPVRGRYVHLFQVGQIDPRVLGLLRQVPYWTTGRWFKFSDAVNVNNIEITIHTANGIQFPRTDSYYMFTDELALIFAVPEQKNFRFPLQDVQIYFRFYQNAAFRQGMSFGNFVCGSAVPKSSQDILDIENQHKGFIGQRGRLRVYVNGVLVERVHIGDTKIGDFIEWVYDPNIKHVYEWRLSELHQFHSVLDNSYKYLLHYPGQNTSTIDYQDDIDVHVVHKPINGFMRGLYLNRLNPKNHRQVTHRDYSVDTAPVDILKAEIGERRGIITPDADQVFVRVYIREASVRRPLIHDSHRIFELYKLKEQDRYRAMIGIDATLSHWHCANLEASAYVRLMGAQYKDVNASLVEEAYGYSGAVKVVADSPIKPFQRLSGWNNFKLPVLTSKETVIYEFDKDGLYLGHYFHENDDDHQSRDKNCELIETIPGRLADYYEGMEGQDNLPVPPEDVSYRVYYKPMEFLHTLDPWTDVTNSDFYRVENGRILINNPKGNEWIAVRTDRNIVAYDTKVKYNDGTLNFSFSENRTGAPTEEREPIRFPVGRYDVWMNRHKLIENIDYVVKWPVAYVINKTLLKQAAWDTEQDVHIRMYGFPELTNDKDPVSEVGWITHGGLSNNKLFNLRDDKILQINVGGRLFHRDTFSFEEEVRAEVILHPLNGLPYEIKEPIIPLRDFLVSDTYKLRHESKVLDTAVSNYLTKKLSDQSDQGLTAITARYPIVSLLMSRLTYLVTTNRLNIPQDRELEDSEIFAIVEPYRWLAEIDMRVQENNSEYFVYVIPHANETPEEVGPMEYRFLQKVAELYMHRLISFNQYYTIN